MSHDNHIDSDVTTATSFEVECDNDLNTTQQQVSNSDSSTTNNNNFDNIKSPHASSSSKEEAKSSHMTETSLRSICTQIDGQSSDIISSPKSTSSSSYIYVSYDLRAISKALSSGTIQPDDIKIIHGCYIFAEDELQDDISNNKYFMVASDCSKDVITSNPPAM